MRQRILKQLLQRHEKNIICRRKRVILLSRLVCALLLLKGIDPETQMPDTLNGQGKCQNDMPGFAYVFNLSDGKAKSLQRSGDV